MYIIYTHENEALFYTQIFKKVVNLEVKNTMLKVECRKHQ
jgi:hypothetical protein